MQISVHISRTHTRRKTSRAGASSPRARLAHTALGTGGRIIEPVLSIASAKKHDSQVAYAFTSSSVVLATWPPVDGIGRRYFGAQ